MAQIQSKLIHNLQYDMMHNGYSYQVQNSSEAFEVGRHYSPLDLAQGNDIALQAIMFEGTVLYRQDENLYYNGLISDAQYSLKGFEQTILKLNNLAYWREGTKQFKLCVLKEKTFVVFLSSYDDAVTLSKALCKFYNKTLDDVMISCWGAFEDVLKPHWIKQQKREAAKVLLKGILEKEVFNIPDTGKNSTPFKDLEFFKWLEKTHQDKSKHNTIESIEEYLKSLGFNKALHKLNEGDYSLMKYCLHFHFACVNGKEV